MREAGPADAGDSAARGVSRVRSGEATHPHFHWPLHRKQLVECLESNHYQFPLGIVIAIHALLIIQETDLRASGAEVEFWRVVVGYVLSILYLVDIVLRVYGYQSSFFHGAWNRIDFFVVVTDVSTQAMDIFLGDMPSLAVLRVCRIARLARFARFLRLFRELDIMLMGFLSAMRAMFWAMVMLVVIVTVFSIIAVEMLHPISVRMAERGFWRDCERCQRAFGSVMGSNLTFMQQIIAGDSWGAVSVPIIEEEPLAAVFLIMVLVIVQFGVLNLLLTVIVDVANSAREQDEARKLADKAQEFEVIKVKLLKICEDLDEDGSGCLSRDELLSGLDNNPEFAQQMALLDIGKDDMHIVFHILDEDRSGTVVYKEFVEQLHKIKSQDTHTTLIFIKGYLSEVRNKVSETQELSVQCLTRAMETASSMQKLLFGGPLLSESSDVASQVLRVPSRSSLRQALSKDSFSSREKKDEEPAPPKALAAPPPQPVLPPMPEKSVGDKDLGSGGNPGSKDETLQGFVRLEQMLVRLEQHIKGELAESARETAGKIDEQLALLRDWGPPAWPTSLSLPEEEAPCEKMADANVSPGRREASPLKKDVVEAATSPGRTKACEAAEPGGDSTRDLASTRRPPTTTGLSRV